MPEVMCALLCCYSGGTTPAKLACSGSQSSFLQVIIEVGLLPALNSIFRLWQFCGIAMVVIAPMHMALVEDTLDSVCTSRTESSTCIGSPLDTRKTIA